MQIHHIHQGKWSERTRARARTKYEKDSAAAAAAAAATFKNEMKWKRTSNGLWRAQKQTVELIPTTQLTIQVNAHFLLQLNHHHCWQQLTHARTTANFQLKNGRSFPCGYSVVVRTQMSVFVDVNTCYACVVVCVNARGGGGNEKRDRQKKSERVCECVCKCVRCAMVFLIHWSARCFFFSLRAHWFSG